MEELCGREFEDFSAALMPVGVYVLYFEGRAVYVGKSLDVFGRLANHRQRMKNRYRSYIRIIRFDKVLVHFCEEHELHDLERELILALRPEGNNQVPLVGVEDGPMVDLEELGVLEEWKSRSKKRLKGSNRRV